MGITITTFADVDDRAKDHPARRGAGKRSGISDIRAGFGILLRARATAGVELSAAFGIFCGVHEVNPVIFKLIAMGAAIGGKNINLFPLRPAEGFSDCERDARLTSAKHPQFFAVYAFYIPRLKVFCLHLADEDRIGLPKFLAWLPAYHAFAGETVAAETEEQRKRKGRNSDF